jgi:hypothetical protein
MSASTADDRFKHEKRFLTRGFPAIRELAPFAEPSMPRTIPLRAALLAMLITVLCHPVFHAAEELAGDALTPAEFARLVEQTSKLVQTALKDRPDDQARNKARTAAVLLAAVAQSGNAGGDAKQRATVRDAALAMADAIKKDQLDDARKGAAALPKLAVNADAQAKALPLLGTHMSFSESMKYFAPDKRGGTGGQRKLDVLGENAQAQKTGVLPRAALTNDLLLLAYTAAVAGDLSRDHNDATVKKDPKAWRRFAEETRSAGLDLAAAVRAQKGDKAWSALNRLNSACFDCHNKFR